MSIVSTSNRWLNRLYKTVAIVLVLLAVLISAFRLFLPYVHHYRLPLQNYLNEKSQTNISIGTLSMTWQKSGPILIIGDVQILNTERASVFIKQLELQVDFWSTISQQNLISKNLILSGATADVSEKLWLDKKDDDSSGKLIKDTEADDISVISDLFLNRITRFSILDSQITVRNKAITRSIRVNQLRWLNTGERHQAEGSVVLNGLSSNNLQLKLDLQGNKGSELTGQMYLQANQIDITPWLDNVLVLEDDKTKTDINFSAWLRVTSSEVNRLQINFSDSSMHWQFENKKQKLTLDQGQLLLVKGKAERNFKLYSTPLSLQLNEQESQRFSVMLAKQESDFSLHLSEIDVAMLAQLTPLIVAKKETRNLLSQMTLTGKIEDLYIRNQNNELQIVTNFSAFNNSYSHGIPGLENVSGSLSYLNNYLAVDFSAEQGNLDFDKLFVQAFPYQSMSGQLNAVFDDKGWALTVEALDFLSEEINLSAQVKVEAPIDSEINLALLANVTNGNAGLVGRYLPLPIMSDNLVNYLNAAVVSGRVENAQILINGPISRFPFTDGSGIFVVDAELSQSEFKFVENWPAITDFVANLNFTNNSMLITGRGGKLTGLDVTGVRAGIADLAHGQILTVDAQIKPTQASYIGDLMNQSPFKDSVGSVLEQLKINGEVSGDFNLNLPLNNNEQALASGTINFDNNQVALQTPKMDFSEVYGQLSFSNDKISTKDLTLHWQGLPVSLDINGMDKADYYNTDINLSALWQESKWLTHVPKELRRYTQGELPWQGKLSLHQHHLGGFSYTANFDSDLTNTQLLLPAPYDRNSEQENRLSLQINGAEAQSKIVLNYGDKMHFSGQLDHQSTAFTRANLMFGQGAMALPSDGFHITTKLAQADFSMWQPLISDIIDSINHDSGSAAQENSVPFLAKPKRIRGSIGQLKILGQELTNVSFNLLDKKQWWLLQLNAKETRSQIKIYPDWLKEGIDINAEFLKLPKNTKEREANSSLAIEQPDRAENDIVFANIPPLTFHCDHCAIGLLDLGEVDVQVKRIDDQTIDFTNFTAKRNKTQLTLTGRWLHNEQESNTALVGKVSVEDIESEMKALSFDSIIKDSGAEIELNLNWNGGLHDFDVTQLNGTVNGRLDDGYLADVSDKGARIFSVLSLQSLVRKLTLDFRDIFSDGMFYSSIKGDYQLKLGTLSTDNTEMNGTAGNLFMTGHTNLVSGELDYDMSYKPNLTSSLPVLAWIATLNPVTFLAGVAIDQVIKSQVVSEFTFELKGTIDNPDFKEVDRKSKSISVESTLPTQGAKQEESVNDDTPVKNSASKSN
ncbi:YhdP family protein [Colwellia sp. 12G3]|uniref:YhdP family protein n=1 Tax=Colwellia sp. 12G3 TaxID=2058299 RepID=UPI000C34A208|nr:YhdP family protein [Colwellia sp. 12G3]PKI13143.1 TIGR02099 family protein [Colwellia sp. 12G3]